MDSFEKSLNKLLVETFNNILKFEEQSLKAISNLTITVNEAHLMEATAKSGNGASVSELASALDLALPSVTVAVKKLQGKGLIHKMQSKEDGRSVKITLTPLGEKINRAHEIFHQKMVRRISRDFHDNEKELLLSVIKKLDEFFDKKVKAKI